VTDTGSLQARVQRAVTTMVASGREIGVQVAAYRNGVPIVSAVAGLADERTGRAVTVDTPFLSYSAGLGVISTVVHVLAERGALDYDLRIADVWPEFARFGKQHTTLRHALSHSAGVPALPAHTMPEDLLDWDLMCRTLAGSTPLWEPGTRHGYHEWTYGWLLGEVVRCTVHRSVSRVLADEIARPLDVDREMFFGVPEARLDRVARLKDRNWTAAMETLSARLENFDLIAPPGVRPDAALGNRRDILRTDIPSLATVSARGLARMYAALMGEVDGVRLVSPARLKEITTVVTQGPDWAFGGDLPKTLGYAAQAGGARFGWSGSGGSLAGCYPSLGLAVAVSRNHLGADDDDPMEHVLALIQAEAGG
jgi:CubicO group peptidase (beta-lactamase class C family)